MLGVAKLASRYRASQVAALNSPARADRLTQVAGVDDGTGIPPGAPEAAAAGEHLGMAGMRDRAQQAGGTLEITSQPGHGTPVSVSQPIRKAAAMFH
jgi:nitrate/nitrite-specific signal transduction histidine kinase